MSIIRPIGDPAIATAMLATMQSIDAARTAPSGISEPRWRILQCIAKAAPNVPSPGELRLCSGLNKAALAEHVQALQWKGLLEMGGYRLSPSAAAMVGVEQPYPPRDAKAIKVMRDANRPEWHDRFAEAHARQFVVPAAPPEHVEKLRAAIAALGVQDMPILPAPTNPVVIGVDFGSRPDVTAKVTGRYRADGGIEILNIELDPSMDPADVPACMRPDCMPPERPVEEARNALLARKSGSCRKDDGAREGDNRPRGRSGRTEAKDLTARRVRRSAEVSRPDRPERLPAAQAEAVRPAAEQLGSPRPQVSAPPATPPKFTNWIEERARRLDAAIRFLKSQAILVSVVDRDAQVRQYFVAGRRDRKFAEEVIEIAIEKGWAE